MSDPRDEDEGRDGDAERGVVRLSAADDGDDPAWIRKLVPRPAPVNGETSHRGTPPGGEDLPPGWTPDGPYDGEGDADADDDADPTLPAGWTLREGTVYDERGRFVGRRYIRGKRVPDHLWAEALTTYYNVYDRWPDRDADEARER